VISKFIQASNAIITHNQIRKKWHAYFRLTVALLENNMTDAFLLVNFLRVINYYSNGKDEKKSVFSGFLSCCPKKCQASWVDFHSSYLFTRRSFISWKECGFIRCIQTNQVILLTSQLLNHLLMPMGRHTTWLSLILQKIHLGVIEQRRESARSFLRPKTSKMQGFII